MKYKFLLLFIFVTNYIYPQQNDRWKGYFSFNNNVAISENSNQAFIASDVNYFKYNVNVNSGEIVSSLNNLKSNIITDIYHDNALNKTIITNANGLVTIVNEQTNQISNLVGILNKPSIPQIQKKINSVTYFNGKAYLSTDFGITELVMSNNLLGDSFIIGDGGQNISVLKTIVFNNDIYAITRYNGIKKADLNANLVDFAVWQTINWEGWSNATVFNNKFILANINGNLQQFISVSNIPVLHSLGSQIKSIKNINNQYLVVTTSSLVKIFDSNLNVIATVNSSLISNSDLAAATLVNNKIIIATLKKGIYSVSLSNTLDYEDITPNGPERNKIVKLKQSTTDIWAVYGDYDQTYNPFIPEFINYLGVSKYNNSQGWTTYPSEDLNAFAAIMDIAIHPLKPKEVYFGSFHNGVIKKDINDGFTFYNQYNTGNTGLEGINYNEHIRIGSLAFDSDQNLWITNSRVEKALKVFKKAGTWESFSLASISSSLNNDSYRQLVVDKNNTKWMTTFRNGVVAFNEKYGNKWLKITTDASAGNLPNTDVRSLAVDNNNALWIGTASGLRVLPSVDRFVNDNVLNTNSIIIMEDGLAQELFYEQTILDIAVDGSNNKWISILESGVFQVSPDGQEVLHRFNVDNSPLPSNTINDIEINGKTGEVFFATDKGLVSFKSTATAPSSDLQNVYIYPNPIRPGFAGDIKIAGLMSGAVVKITDISGSLVYETTSSGGTVIWDQTAFGKHKVATGVYMVFVSNSEGTETATKKIMIVR